MHRETEKIEAIVNEMLGIVPKLAGGKDRLLASALMDVSSRWAEDSRVKNQEVKKALVCMSYSLSHYLCEAAEEKGRTVELAELLIKISSAIINGGNPKNLAKNGYNSA